MDGLETVIDVLPFLIPLILLEFAHGASTAAFFVCITLALLLIGVAAIIASQMTWGLLSITAGVLVAAPQLVLGPLSGGAIVQVLSYPPWSLWMIAFGIMLLVSPTRWSMANRGVIY
ncbi:hypothetical protein ES707_11066 [subsurface metagenome]